jgi:CheY-like chemotaxis protein
MSYEYQLGYEDAVGFADADMLVDVSGVAELDADLHILFVGKDPAIAELYGRKLALDGYRLSFVWSEEEACQAALRLGPDVIYLDLTHSPEWGTQILRAIRDDPTSATTPAVLLVSRMPRANPITLGRHDFSIPVPELPS